MVTPASPGFPRTARLLRPAEFANVYERRQSVASGPLVVYAAANGCADGRVRLGLSVSRRIGTAVVRNRWKRRLREAFRVVRASLPAGTDIVIVVRSGAPPVGADGAAWLRETITTLSKRIASRPGFGKAAGDVPARPKRRGRA